MNSSSTDKKIAKSEFSAALHSKCPRCRRGNMFKGPMYGLHLQKMNDRCPHCNLLFEREPGYFYVAMFVSYGMSVAETVIMAVLTYFFSHSENPWVYIGVVFIGILLLSPFNFRYSRTILLYWLTPKLHFDPEMSKDRRI